MVFELGLSRIAFILKPFKREIDLNCVEQLLKLSGIKAPAALLLCGVTWRIGERVTWIVWKIKCLATLRFWPIFDMLYRTVKANKFKKVRLANN